jgi:isopenicillin-N epimerase
MNTTQITSAMNTSFKRRNFLKQLVAGSVATLAYPALSNAGGLEHDDRPIPSGNVEDERYWEQVKKQFTMPPNLMMLNAANLCPSPYFINDLV